MELIDRMKKAQQAVYLACEEPVARDIAEILGLAIKEIEGHEQAQSELLSTLRPKDHEIAQCVNNLTKIAKEFGHTQQLREHISKEVLNLLNQLKD